MRTLKHKFRYGIGLVLILAVLYIILFSPLTVLIYPDLPYLGLLKRVVGVLVLASVFCLYRVFKGPTSSDRIVAVDMLGVLIVGLCAVLTIVTSRHWYLDIGIAWALQSFISTLALSKFLEDKHFDE